MFEPMFAGDLVPQLILWGIAIAGFVVGFWWIHRITKDVEDN